MSSTGFFVPHCFSSFLIFSWVSSAFKLPWWPKLCELWSYGRHMFISYTSWHSPLPSLALKNLTEAPETVIWKSDPPEMHRVVIRGLPLFYMTTTTAGDQQVCQRSEVMKNNTCFTAWLRCATCHVPSCNVVAPYSGLWDRLHSLAAFDSNDLHDCIQAYIVLFSI